MHRTPSFKIQSRVVIETVSFERDVDRITNPALKRMAIGGL